MPLAISLTEVLLIELLPGQKLTFSAATGIAEKIIDIIRRIRVICLYMFHQPASREPLHFRKDCI